MYLAQTVPSLPAVSYTHLDVYKRQQDLVLVQHFVQVDVAAEDLAFARLDDEAVDGLVEEFF